MGRATRGIDGVGGGIHSEEGRGVEREGEEMTGRKREGEMEMEMEMGCDRQQQPPVTGAEPVTPGARQELARSGLVFPSVDQKGE